MYANKDNPPPPIFQPHISMKDHVGLLSRMNRQLRRIREAQGRWLYNTQQYQLYAPDRSPFVSRSGWIEAIKKSEEEILRLERCYLENACELARRAYEQVVRQ
jgi:hypothetical protein